MTLKMDIVSTEDKDVCASITEVAGLQNLISHCDDGNQGTDIKLNNMDLADKEDGKFFITTIKFVINQSKLKQ